MAAYAGFMTHVTFSFTFFYLIHAFFGSANSDKDTDTSSNTSAKSLMSGKQCRACYTLPCETRLMKGILEETQLPERTD